MRELCETKINTVTTSAFLATSVLPDEATGARRPTPTTQDFRSFNTSNGPIIQPAAASPLKRNETPAKRNPKPTTHAINQPSIGPSPRSHPIRIIHSSIHWTAIPGTQLLTRTTLEHFSAFSLQVATKSAPVDPNHGPNNQGTSGVDNDRARNTHPAHKK